MQIDWDSISKAYEEDKDRNFNWKYDGSYYTGKYDGLMAYADNKLSEVIGFMKEPSLDKKDETELDKEMSIKTKMMFDAYSKVDFATLTFIINENYTNSTFNDGDLFKCSDYIPLDKKEYETNDIQKILKGFCDAALSRYKKTYKNWILDNCSDEWKPDEEFYCNGILIKIDNYGVEISYKPISIYVDISEYSDDTDDTECE